MVQVVVLSLTVERGYVEGGKILATMRLCTQDLRVHALLRGSNSPTSRCPEAVDWIMREVTGGANPCARGGGGLYRVRQDPQPPSDTGVQCTLR